MALPTSRDYPATDAGDLAHTVVNNLQDAIVNGAHGLKTLMLPAAMAETDYVQPLTYETAGKYGSSSSATSQIDVPIPLHVGDRIHRVKVYGQEGDNVAEYFRAKIYRVPGAAATSIQVSGTKESTAGSGGLITLEWTSADADIPATLLIGWFYVVQVQMFGTTTDREAFLKGIEIDYDHP